MMSLMKLPANQQAPTHNPAFPPSSTPLDTPFPQTPLANGTGPLGGTGGAGEALNMKDWQEGKDLVETRYPLYGKSENICNPDFIIENALTAC